MRRIGVALALVMVLAVTTGPLNAANPAGAIAGDIKEWVLIGGANPDLPAGKRTAAFGAILVARGESPDVIPAELNPRTRAAGNVIVGTECRGATHFHGLFLDTDDGGQNCGWGAVIALATAPTEIAGFANAIDAETEANELVFKTIPPDYERAKTLVGVSEEALRRAKRAMSGSKGTYKAARKKRLLALITKIQTKDRQISSALTRLAAGRPNDTDRQNVKKRLREALEIKRNALNLMVQARKLLSGHS